MKKISILLPILLVALFVTGCNVQEGRQIEQTEIKETQNLIGILDKGQINVYNATTQSLIKVISDDRFDQGELSLVMNKMLKFNQDESIYYISKDHNLLEVNLDGSIKIVNNLKDIYTGAKYNWHAYYIDSINQTIASYYYNNDSIGELYFYDIKNNIVNTMEDEKHRMQRSSCSLENNLLTCPIGYNEISGAHIWNWQNTIFNFGTKKIDRIPYIDAYQILFDTDNKHITTIQNQKLRIDIQYLRDMFLSSNGDNTHIYSSFITDSYENPYESTGEKYIDETKLPESYGFIGWIDNDLCLFTDGDEIVWYEIK